MAYRSILLSVLLSATSLLFTGCQPGDGSIIPDHKAENLIGVPLTANSKLQSATEDDSDKVVIFDKTIRKVHHFDLDSSTHLGKYEVNSPEEDHFLIYGSSQKYFVDLTKRQINIQTIGGDKAISPIKFVGTPLSATFDAKKGYLIVYDSYQSVMIYKLDERGGISKSFISGPEIKDQGTIQAGDISAGGKLVLSVRGNPAVTTGAVVDFIVSIDIEAALEKQTLNDPLVFTKIPTTLTEMNWIAPVLGADNLMLIRSAGKISTMDLVTSTITSIPTEDWLVEKYSKIKDSHIVMRKSYDYYASLNGNVERRIYFVEAGVLKSKTLTKNFNFILNSHLDLKRGYWNVTKTNIATEYDLYNSYNTYFQGRSFTRIRTSDLLSIIDKEIANDATVEMANDYLFSLFPSPMGYATRTDIETSKTNVLKNFNIKDMK